MKRRFHVLHGEVRLSPQKACQVIMACGVLHNICKKRNIPMPEDDVDVAPPPAQGLDVHDINVNNGNLYRQQFAQTHFN